MAEFIYDTLNHRDTIENFCARTVVGRPSLILTRPTSSTPPSEPVPPACGHKRYYTSAADGVCLS